MLTGTVASECVIQCVIRASWYQSEIRVLVTGTRQTGTAEPWHHDVGRSPEAAASAVRSGLRAFEGPDWEPPATGLLRPCPGRPLPWGLSGRNAEWLGPWTYPGSRPLPQARICCSAECLRERPRQWDSPGLPAVFRPRAPPYRAQGPIDLRGPFSCKLRPPVLNLNLELGLI